MMAQKRIFTRIWLMILVDLPSMVNSTMEIFFPGKFPQKMKLTES